MVAALMTVVPELNPQDVGVPFPVAPQIIPESYTYDYIIIGGPYSFLNVLAIYIHTN